jgi:restriction endonuclease Mrr
MLPLLRFASDGKEHQLKDAAEHLAKEFGLTKQIHREPHGVTVDQGGAALA